MPSAPDAGMPDPAGRISFVTLGCKVNQADSDGIAAAVGSRRPERLAGPPVIVINTCTVTAEADAKSRKAIRRALAADDEAVVIVTGCMAAVDPDGVAAIAKRIVVEPAKEKVADRINRITGASDAPPPSDETACRHARVQVKVQDGCDAFCAYCIVPSARGVPRSTPAAEVAAEVARLHSAGVGEIVLTGINIGRYADGALRLPGLVRLIADTGVARIRISSIEPGDVTPEFLAALAATPAVAPHLHVPLQSGCERTLAAMGRRYGTEAYLGTIERIREVLPGVALTTDLLVGFPGESEEDFEETLAFVGRVGFSRLHVFRYSARTGTPAADRDDQVPAAVKADRSARARALGAELARAWTAGRVGSVVSVLVERVADGHAEGTSGEYIRVRFPVPDGEDIRPGVIIDVLLTGADGASAEGVIASAL